MAEYNQVELQIYKSTGTVQVATNQKTLRRNEQRMKKQQKWGGALTLSEHLHTSHYIVVSYT